MEFSESDRQQAKKYLVDAMRFGTHITATIKQEKLAERGATRTLMNALLHELLMVRAKAEESGLRFKSPDILHQQYLAMPVRDLSESIHSACARGERSKIEALAGTLGGMFDDLRPLLRADFAEGTGKATEIHVLNLKR